ncbi:MAG: hypothetical protein HOI80_05650, partial [Alphaproteobacteria bacterium]|nr:hypothetical protein [Alphaproteobacteria bacterium]
MLIPEYSLSTRIGIFEESDEPPPGFEAVDVAEETNYVEAYFFGNLLGSSLMTYQDNKVVIKNPGLLVKKMKGLKDPEAVLKALTGEIAGNSELACSNENARQPCGILSPKVAAVIYDRFKRELSIFVNADLLDKKELEFDQLPRSTSNFSFLNNVFVNSTGSKRERNYTVNNRNVFAYKEAFIDIDSSYFLDEGDTSLSTVGEKRFRFSTITGNLNRWNKTFQIGTVRNEGSNFLSSQLLIGGKFFTTLNQLTDLNSAQSTPIEVFLALPGEVQVFRDKKLLYAQNYTAGNQFINTSSFPAGNYDV